MSGYKGFGSFHSDNVEELLRIPADAYIVPPLPEDVCAPAMPAAADIEFGRAFAKHYFLDLSRWTFVNHGAFGASLRLAIEAANAWRAHAEVQPLLFYDRELFPHLVASLRGMAAAVHTAPTNIVFTPNATTGCVTSCCCQVFARAVDCAAWFACALACGINFNIEMFSESTRYWLLCQQRVNRADAGASLEHRRR